MGFARKREKRVSEQTCHLPPTDNVTKFQVSAPGIVGSKQLEHIRTFTERPTESDTITTEKKVNSCASLKPTKCHLSPEDERIINTVMLKVAELNVNKLPDSSLVKVLTSVYLDAKSRLEDKKTCLLTESSGQCLSDSSNPKAVCEQKSPSYSATEHQGTPAPMSISERKKLQWATEKAELSKLGSYDPWMRTVSTNTENLNVGTHIIPISPVMVNSAGSSHTCALPNSSSAAPSISHVSSFTPVALGANEDAELLRREMQRRRWKAELDEQVRQHRLLQEKERLEDNKYNVVPQKSSVAFHGFSGCTASDSGTTFPHHTTNPHPSDSHFSFALVPDAMYPIPTPTVKSQLPPSGLSDSNTASGPNFNRTRGFTQELYSSPSDEAARIRRAREISRINLEQIEEKRRLKEEEKAKRLQEERLEEARLEQERARLAAITEAELRERQIRETEADEKNKALFDALQRAREEAAVKKKRMLLDRLHTKEQEAYGQADHDSSNYRMTPFSKCAESCAPRINSPSSPHSRQKSTKPSTAWSGAALGAGTTVPDVVPSVAAREDAECQTVPWHESRMLPGFTSSKSASCAPAAPRTSDANGTLKRNVSTTIGECPRGYQSAITKQTPAPHAKTRLSQVTTPGITTFHGSTYPSNKTVKSQNSRAPGGSNTNRLGVTRNCAATSVGHCHPTAPSNTGQASHCGSGADNERVVDGQSSTPLSRMCRAPNSLYLRSDSSSEKRRSRIPILVTGRSSSLNRSQPSRPNATRSSPVLSNDHSVSQLRTYTAFNLLRTDDVLPSREEANPDGYFLYEEAHLKTAPQRSITPPSYQVEPVVPCASPVTKQHASEHRMDLRMNSGTCADLPPHSDTNQEYRAERQNTILQHLSEIRRGLKMRQMLCESGTYDDEEDYK